MSSSAVDRIGRRAWLGGISALGAALIVGRGEASAQPAEGVLQVHVVGFRDRRGQAIVALHEAQDGWLDAARARRVSRTPIPRRRQIFAQFTGVPRGRDYAVSVVHDANRSGGLDMEWLPIPHPGEGTGASRNPRPTLGPPGWDSARFRFTADRRIVITLVY